MNTDTKYFEIKTIKELHSIYYVAAESQEQAEELAWKHREWEDEVESPRHDYEYETITEEAEKDWNDEWLVEDEDGDAVYVELN